MNSERKIKQNTYINVFVKAFWFLVLFVIFHTGYDITKWQFLRPFCGINESVFQHLKMAFWAYISLSFIEFFVSKKRIKNFVQFLYSRMLSSIFVPWVIFIIWYIIPVIHGKIYNFFGDLFWALIVTYMSGLFVIIIEKDVEASKLSNLTKVILIFLFFALAFLFIYCSYHLPWIDVFTLPKY